MDAEWDLRSINGFNLGSEDLIPVELTTKAQRTQNYCHVYHRGNSGCADELSSPVPFTVLTTGSCHRSGCVEYYPLTLAAITLLGYQILTQGSSLLQSLTAAIQTINFSNLPFGEYLRQMDRPPLAPNEPEE
jgi:hypothetical protein